MKVGAKKQSERQQTHKRRVNTWIVTVLSLALVITVGALAWRQMSSYEAGVLDVYASQQDGYVQLVLDQINLNQQRSDKEIITDILGTLDASSRHYWTFSRQDSLIFVRDVLETNRYKGFTETTYFHSESAQSFLERLETNRVIHDTIMIEEVPYVASGVEFTYSGENYKICLLTNAETVLDHNSYLNAKINLIVLSFVLLGIVVISLIFLALLAERSRKQLWRQVDDNVVLRKKITALDEKLKWGELYDPECTAFKSGALPIILKKLEQRQAWPLSIYRYHTLCPAHEVLETSSLKEARLLQVLNGEHELLLFLLERGGADAEKHPLAEIEGVEFLGALHVTEAPEISLEQSYLEFMQEEEMHGTATSEKVHI